MQVYKDLLVCLGRFNIQGDEVDRKMLRIYREYILLGDESDRKIADLIEEVVESREYVRLGIDELMDTIRGTTTMVKALTDYALTEEELCEVVWSLYTRDIESKQEAV